MCIYIKRLAPSLVLGNVLDSNYCYLGESVYRLQTIDSNSIKTVNALVFFMDKIFFAADAHY